MRLAKRTMVRAEDEKSSSDGVGVTSAVSSTGSLSRQMNLLEERLARLSEQKCLPRKHGQLSFPLRSVFFFAVKLWNVQIAELCLLSWLWALFPSPVLFLCDYFSSAYDNNKQTKANEQSLKMWTTSWTKYEAILTETLQMLCFCIPFSSLQTVGSTKGNKTHKCCSLIQTWNHPAGPSLRH